MASSDTNMKGVKHCNKLELTYDPNDEGVSGEGDEGEGGVNGAEEDDDGGVVRLVHLVRLGDAAVLAEERQQ